MRDLIINVTPLWNGDELEAGTESGDGEHLAIQNNLNIARERVGYLQAKNGKVARFLKVGAKTPRSIYRGIHTVFIYVRL